MKITVVGAGAIGQLVAALLHQKSVDVCLVARDTAAKVINDSGVNVSGCQGVFCEKVPVYTRIPAKQDVVVLATKTQDLAVALEEYKGQISDSIILTTQNGVRADTIAAQFLPKENIFSSIVMFGATSFSPGEVVYNFSGSWILGSMFDNGLERLESVVDVLKRAFSVETTENISGMKYTKIFVNANNCIPAILGMSMQESFSDLRVCALSVAIWKEGLVVTQNAGIKLVSLPDFDINRVYGLTQMPSSQAAGIISKIMTGLSTEPVYGSILQSIKRGKQSEIDFINGEFISLASTRTQAPLNACLVELVHETEKSRKHLKIDELLTATQGLYN